MTELTLLVNGDVLAFMRFKFPSNMAYTVAFDEADGEGIVFFGNYFRLAHRALERFLPTLGISWTEWFANKDWGVPLRHVEADYLHSLRPGDEYGVNITIDKIGDSSVHFAYEFLHPEGKIFARLKTSHVFLSRQTREKIEIPAQVKERLAAGMNQRSTIP